MDRKLNCFFQIDTVVADSVAGFELVEELGRPTALEIDVRFASAITSENALGLSAFFSFGVGQEEEHTFLGIVEQVTVIGSALTGATTADGSGAAFPAALRAGVDLTDCGGAAAGGTGAATVAMASIVA